MPESTGPSEKLAPHYELEEVRRAFRDGDFAMTNRVRRYLRRNAYLRASMEGIMATLPSADFHKSQQHLAIPTRWLDIYRPRWRGCRLYVKFTEQTGEPGFVLLSFCYDGESH